MARGRLSLGRVSTRRSTALQPVEPLPLVEPLPPPVLVETVIPPTRVEPTIAPPPVRVATTRPPPPAPPTPTLEPEMSFTGIPGIPGGTSLGGPLPTNYPTTRRSSSSGGLGIDLGGIATDAIGDLARRGVDSLIDRLTGSGSEPPTGESPVPGSSGGGCEPGYYKLPGTTVCIDPSAAAPGGQPLTMQVDNYGAAGYGRYGLSLGPAVMPTQRLSCPEGMVLGKDNRCYNKTDLKNSERKWPKPPRPLMTSGEMAAIAKASRAANRLVRTQKRLKKVGKAIEKAC